ncbi:MAG: cytochrome c biogenesis protein CcdA [Vicinamibacterales bacterium]|nr:cytochrome c biogenesis protein CcdA [Vicinamibacterales bacterium]
MENVTLFTAFIAGVLSFISPCVLPLIPGYLSYISGVSLEEMRGPAAGGGAAGVAASVQVVNPRVMMTSVAFVLGFSLVFVSLGASATYFGQFLMERLTLLGKVAGVILIIFGLHMMGVFRIGWLYQEARIQTKSRPTGFIGAMLVGIAFAFGWTPCIGPILAGILTVAAVQDTVGEGIRLLAVYSAGLGIPFLLAALAIDHFFTAFHKIRRHYRKIEIVSGLLLIIVGVLIFTNRFTVIAQWLTPYLPVF